MHAIIETSAFLGDAAAAGMSEEERFAVVNFIAENPTAGVLMPGTGGAARKIRFAGRGKGKSGGYRVLIYFAAGGDQQGRAGELVKGRTERVEERALGDRRRLSHGATAHDRTEVEEEIMSKLGKRLIAAAKEARKIARGDADPSSYRLHLPDDIDVQLIRKSLGLSQTAFAAKFGIAPGTLRDWEQRRKQPDGPARVLLTVIKHESDAVDRALKHEVA
jgi:putative transcriptional regulator